VDSHNFENVFICPVAAKVKYTWLQARRELERLKRTGRPPEPGFHLEPYYCKFCHGFHVGSQANRINFRNKGRDSSND